MRPSACDSACDPPRARRAVPSTRPRLLATFPSSMPPWPPLRASRSLSQTYCGTLHWISAKAHGRTKPHAKSFPTSKPKGAEQKKGGRCRPQRPWGSSSLPPYEKNMTVREQGTGHSPAPGRCRPYPPPAHPRQTTPGCAAGSASPRPAAAWDDAAAGEGPSAVLGCARWLAKAGRQRGQRPSCCTTLPRLRMASP